MKAVYNIVGIVIVGIVVGIAGNILAAVPAPVLAPQLHALSQAVERCNDARMNFIPSLQAVMEKAAAQVTSNEEFLRTFVGSAADEYIAALQRYRETLLVNPRVSFKALKADEEALLAELKRRLQQRATDQSWRASVEPLLNEMVQGEALWKVLEKKPSLILKKVLSTYRKNIEYLVRTELNFKEAVEHFLQQDCDQTENEYYALTAALERMSSPRPF